MRNPILLVVSCACACVLSAPLVCSWFFRAAVSRAESAALKLNHHHHHLGRLIIVSLAVQPVCGKEANDSALSFARLRATWRQLASSRLFARSLITRRTRRAPVSFATRSERAKAPNQSRPNRIPPHPPPLTFPSLSSRSVSDSRARASSLYYFALVCILFAPLVFI